MDVGDDAAGCDRGGVGLVAIGDLRLGGGVGDILAVGVGLGQALPGVGPGVAVLRDLGVGGGGALGHAVEGQLELLRADAVLVVRVVPLHDDGDVDRLRHGGGLGLGCGLVGIGDGAAGCDRGGIGLVALGHALLGDRIGDLGTVCIGLGQAGPGVGPGAAVLGDRRLDALGHAVEGQLELLRADAVLVVGVVPLHGDGDVGQVDDARDAGGELVGGAPDVGAARPERPDGEVVELDLVGRRGEAALVIVAVTGEERGVLPLGREVGMLGDCLEHDDLLAQAELLGRPDVEGLAALHGDEAHRGVLGVDLEAVRIARLDPDVVVLPCLLDLEDELGVLAGDIGESRDRALLGREAVGMVVPVRVAVEERVGLGVLEVEVVLPTLFSADLGGDERLGTLVEVAFTEAVEVHGDGLGALALAAIPDLRERDGDVDGGVLVDLVVLGRKSLGAEQRGGDGHDGDDGDHQHLLDLHVRSLLVPCCCSAQGSDSVCSLPVPYTHHRTGSSHIRGDKI